MGFTVGTLAEQQAINIRAADNAYLRFCPAPLPYRTSLNIAKELISRQLESAAQAFDIWKAHCHLNGGKGEIQLHGNVIAILVAGGMSKSSAKRAIKLGIDLLWDRRPDKKDQRQVWYHLRGYPAIQNALGLSSCGTWARLPLGAYQGTSGDYAAHVFSAWLEIHPSGLTDLN
jgi:hypothetical protein